MSWIILESDDGVLLGGAHRHLRRLGRGAPRLGAGANTGQGDARMIVAIYTRKSTDQNVGDKAIC